MEVLIVSVLALLVFLYTFMNFESRWIMGVLFALVFIALYTIVSHGIKYIRQEVHKYNLTPQHLHIHRKTKRKSLKDKVNVKHIIDHRLDKFFCGATLLMKDMTRHVLFFNSREEVEKFEEFLKKHVKKKANA